MAWVGLSELHEYHGAFGPYCKKSTNTRSGRFFSDQVTYGGRIHAVLGVCIRGCVAWVGLPELHEFFSIILAGETVPIVNTILSVCLQREVHAYVRRCVMSW